jgi:cell division septation protein DedD
VSYRSILAGALLIRLTALAQDADVQRYIGMINNGQVEEVRGQVPALLEQYPNHPGVLYVQALVTKEGAEAARVYQSIVDNFPRSAYADAALYRIYQFYYALGLYRTAELKMAQLKRDYPASRYLQGDPQETAHLPEELPRATDTVAVDAAVPAPVTVPGTQPAEMAAVMPAAFTLQVGAYGARENAEKQRKFFSDLGYSVETITKVRESRTLHVVLVGNFATQEEARAKGAEFKKKYKIDSMVVSR